MSMWRRRPASDPRIPGKGSLEDQSNVAGRIDEDYWGAQGGGAFPAA